MVVQESIIIFLAKGLLELLLLLLLNPLFFEHSGLEGRVPELMLFYVRLAGALLIISLVKLSVPPTNLLIDPHSNHVKVVASRCPTHVSNFVQLSSLTFMWRHPIEERWGLLGTDPVH